MPHRTVPSFTVEIKRARKPSVHALTRKVVVPDRDNHHRRMTFPSKDIFAETNPPSGLSLDSGAVHDIRQVSAGRILPSFAPMNSLQAREQQETKEGPPQQRMARTISGRVATGDALDSATAPREGLASLLNTAELVPPTPVTQEVRVMASSSADMPSSHVDERRSKKGKHYGAAYRTAMRRGLALPPLPAGERWKRRLPPACR
jgi:hypothetical protein